MRSICSELVFMGFRLEALPCVSFKHTMHSTRAELNVMHLTHCCQILFKNEEKCRDSDLQDSRTLEVKNFKLLRIVMFLNLLTQHSIVVKVWLKIVSA